MDIYNTLFWAQNLHSHTILLYHILYICYRMHWSNNEEVYSKRSVTNTNSFNDASNSIKYSFTPLIIKVD